MARRVEEVTISAAGRDFGKKFVLTEMPSSHGEEWALRALIALSRSGLAVPDELIEMGWAGVALFGLKGLAALSFEEAKPLLDEMMACVKRSVDAVPEGRALVEDDIEEIRTRIYLRARVFDLHASFSQGASLSALLAPKTPPPGSENIPTLTPASES